jgi:anti-anti-sigma regulatory factor
MGLRVDRKGNVALVKLDGRLRFGHGDEQLRQTFDQLLASGVERYVFDLRDAEQLDSAFVGEILACHKKAVASHARVHVVLVRGGRIDELFRTTHLFRVIPLFEDEAKAIAAFPS